MPKYPFNKENMKFGKRSKTCNWCVEKIFEGTVNRENYLRNMVYLDTTDKQLQSFVIRRYRWI